jgi:Tol biopolymer transport system component
MISYWSDYKLLFINADGSGSRGIPLDAQTYGTSCWVPGQHEILVHMLKERAICATPLSGKPYCRVVAKGKPCAFYPCLSPDKTFIVYYSGSFEGGKVVRAPYSPEREPSPSDVRELTRYDSSMPALSRDGKNIAFCQGGALWIMSSDGTGHREVPKSKSLSCREPAWSPDGKKLAFVSVERQPSAGSQGCRRVKIVDLQSGNVKTISPDSHTWCSTPSWTP